MKGVYTGMVDRLKSGNTSLALNVFADASRSTYQAVFNTLGGDVATAAAQLGDVISITMLDESAEVILRRGTGDAAQVFPVYLILCPDGVWRIVSM